MAKYIECEAAYRFAQDQLKKETGAYSRGWNHAMNVMKSALHNNDAIPAADVVPVVRCGECKYCVEHYDTDGNAPYWVCKEWDSGTDYDGYCHYGEKKGR